MSFKNSSLFVVVVSLFFAGIVFIVLNEIPLRIIPCTDSLAQNFILTFCLTLVLHLFAIPRIQPRHYKSFLAVDFVLILFSIWLGLYPVSPLGYSTGRIPVLRGFGVMTNRKGITNIPLNGVITLGNRAAADIYPITISGNVRCTWMSANDGALDDPHSCDTAYIPPQADYDILRVSVQLGCGLPASTGQFKVSILP